MKARLPKSWNRLPQSEKDIINRVMTIQEQNRPSTLPGRLRKSSAREVIPQNTLISWRNYDR